MKQERDEARVIIEVCHRLSLPLFVTYEGCLCYDEGSMSAHPELELRIKQLAKVIYRELKYQ